MGRRRRERGQASIELLAVLPLVGVLALAAWQLLLLGQSCWLTGVAVRAAGRAASAGRAPDRAARAALPAAWGRRVSVRTVGGDVVVRVRVPALLGAGALGSIAGRAGGGGAR